jgi:metal-responsive CopG/Arc/MetJ family transcriptional regulator
MPKESTVQVKNNGRMVKTTINLPEKTWQDFSVKVIQKEGGRKKNDVINELIERYLKE